MHKDGDLEHEGKPKTIEWRKSATKQFLKKCFREKAVLTDYEDAKQAWKDLSEPSSVCKDEVRQCFCAKARKYA